MVDNIDTTASFPSVFEPSFSESTTPATRLALIHPFDTYYWEKVSGPTCINGQLHETWCYVECAGGTCQTLWCEDRIVGSC